MSTQLRISYENALHVENGIRNISGICDVIVDINRIEGSEVIYEKIKEAIEQNGYIFK